MPKTSDSARRRRELYEVRGGGYDRDPCPHVLRSKELVPDPIGGGNPVRVRTVDAACIRPAAHVRESRLIPSKHGEAVTVPDDDARLHATDDGRTWR